MNRKKLISLVAASLLYSGVAEADNNALYVPLTTSSNDASWILSGVIGFSNGVGSNTTTTTSFSAGMTELEDTNVNDNLATEGLDVSGKHLASLQQIGSLTQASVGVDISGVAYSETEPVRSMYIRVNSSTPNLKFNYKASLEGKTMEIMVNNDTTKKYQVTISDEFTYNNAAIAVDATGSGGSTSPLTQITALFDRDASDNPTDAARWDKDKHADTTSSVALAEFFHFNALTQQWEVFKVNNVANANDFTEFAAGDAYWGRVDKGDNPPSNDNDGATTLVLGKSGNTTQDQLAAPYSGKLTNGWNHLSFDDIKPYIRHAATGLNIGSANALAAGDSLTITDDSGAYSYTVSDIDMDGSNSLDVNDVKLFNVAIESARLRGELPEAFHLKAIRVTDTNWVLIADKKFYVSGSSTADVKTLYGNNPYVNGTQTAVSSIAGAGANVSSVYGEYALIVKPLVGSGTADAEGASGYGFSKVRFGYYTSAGTGLNPISITSSAATVADVVSTINTYNPTSDFNPKAIELDMDFSGDATDDVVLIASNIPFYIMDNTFARVYKFDSTNGGTLTIPATTPGSVTVNAADTAANVATAIDGAGVSDAKGATDTSGNLVLVSTTSTREIKDDASGSVDILHPTTSGDDIAKGAISDVSGVDAIAKRAITQHDITITNFDDPDENGDGISIAMFGHAAVSKTLSTAIPTNADVKTFFDDVVSEINSQLQTQGIYGYASHDFTYATGAGATTATLGPGGAFDGTTIRIVGIDGGGNFTTGKIGGTYLSDVDGSAGGGIYQTIARAENSTNPDKFNIAGSLTQDLKYNPIYTPNFAQYGPLYTMYDAGYVIKAILRATTKWSDGSIAWDSIDTTRDETDWFANNEFNVFDVSIKSGYWVYLEDKASAAASDPRYENNITISNPTFTATYSYNFANANTALGYSTNYTTVNNVVGGSFSVNVDGLSNNQETTQGTSSNVYLTIGGTEIQMKHDTGTKYTAEINKFNVSGFNESAGIIGFTIRATNGLGVDNKVNDLFSFDYQKPEKPSLTISSINRVALASTSSDVAKYYVFKDYIPENNPDSSTNLINTVDEANASAVNICQNLNFGQQYDLRIVAADGDGAIGSSNLSDALQYNYINLGKNARVLSHTYGALKASTPVVYDSSCELAVPQPIAPANDGVSLKVLVNGQSARLVYNEVPNVSFDTDVAWTAIYSTAGSGGTPTFQIQSVAAYAGKSFYVEYDGKLYSGTFPATQDAATQSTSNAIALTQISSYNGTLAP